MKMQIPSMDDGFCRQKLNFVTGDVIFWVLVLWIKATMAHTFIIFIRDTTATSLHVANGLVYGIIQVRSRTTLLI